MKKTAGMFCVALLLACIPLAAAAQEGAEEGQITLRILKVTWYAEGAAGVKIVYQDFSNEPHLLYLPRSFHQEHYRYVEAPKYSGDVQGVPLLLVHMQDGGVRFVDIYTEYQRSSQQVADFTREDLERFKEAEERGTVELTF
ncbi:MAG: hypothetical protein ACOC8N_04930 [Spirochaetota bacterium]